MDIILKGGMVYQTHRKCFEQMDVGIKGSYIYTTGRDITDSAGQIVDCTGKYLIPGLIDIHMHIESSMTYPQEFSKRVLPYGVTTVVADPHEMANVFGVAGIRAFMEQKTNLDIFYGIPSSVPATNETIETAGAVIREKEVLELLEEEQVICLGEVMNYGDLVSKEDTLIKRIIKTCKEHKKSLVIEGHCPKLPEKDVAKFIYAGVDSDHTQQSAQSVYEKINLGMFLEMQKKSLTQETIDVINENQFYERIALITDDTMPDHLLKGQLNEIVKEAVRLGMPMEQAIYCATWTPAMRMNLRDRGSIAPGKIADIVVLDQLEEFQVEAVYKNGSLYQGEAETACMFPSEFYHSIFCKEAEESDFILKTEIVQDGYVTAHVMKISEVGNFTSLVTRRIRVKNHIVQWEESGLCLGAIYERYKKTGTISYGLIEGTLTKSGAVATSWSHDCHNLFVLGNSPKDMVLAQKKILETQGGYAVASHEKVLAFASLNVGGIIFDGSLEQLANDLANVRDQIRQLGYKNSNEIMSISTLALPVSPEVKLTDKGLFHVRKQKFVPLFQSET